MRRILIENARRKASARRGGNLAQHSLQEGEAVVDSEDHQLSALHEALDQLAESQPTIGQLVKLRYFAGLTVDQAAQTLQISPRTAKRYWIHAKAWLGRQMDPTIMEER
jgi:RNA polymerase sigma factor (TIGR02999 family)